MKDIIDRLSILEPDHKFIKDVANNYNDLKIYINKDSKIRIALLGLYSSGKSTILNTIIGKNILPTNSNECTKIGIIIRYHKEDKPELYKTKFIPKLDYYIFEDSNEPICSGFNDVKKKLKELNRVNEKFEDSFYILKIKIEFYDEYQIEDELKEKIELIDFPGLHTENNFDKKEIFAPLIKFIDGYIFVNKNDLIEEKSNFEALIYIINIIQSRRFCLNTDTFLFILNNFKTEELKIENAKKKLDEIIFGNIIKKEGWWGKLLKKEEKYETKLNVVQFNAKYYLNYMDFKEEINDFKSYMKKCLNDMKEEEEEDFFKYFKEIYISNFKNTAVDINLNEEVINLYYNLCDILKADNDVNVNNFEKIKTPGYEICKRYLAMKNNLKDYEQYKQSNALECFGGIKNQFKKIKSNLDDNFKNIYNNYIKNLVYIFELINLNLKGENLSKTLSIDKFKKDIDYTYNEYNDKILKEKQTLQITSFNKIDEYIKNIDSFSNPQDKAIEVVNEISELFKNFIQSVNKKIEEYKKGLQKIKIKLEKLILDNSININFDSSIFLNFYSLDHLKTHMGIIVATSIFSLIGPIGWICAIGIHGAIAYSKLKKDIDNEKNTLKKNMEDYKKNLKVKFEGNESIMVEILINLKKDAEKKIENFINSQKNVFKGIQKHKTKYKEILDDFKQNFCEEKKGE